MTPLDFRKKLNFLLNEAAKTVDADSLSFPLVEAAGGILVLASQINRHSLEGPLEVLHHRLDLAVAEARVHYATD